VAALAGWIPSGRAGCSPARLTPGRPTSVHGRLLQVLSVPDAPYVEELLDWLRAQCGVEQPYGMDLAILEGAGALADETHPPWHPPWAARAVGVGAGRAGAALVPHRSRTLPAAAASFVVSSMGCSAVSSCARDPIRTSSPVVAASSVKMASLLTKLFAPRLIRKP
jgi:hypothetical protein